MSTEIHSGDYVVYGGSGVCQVTAIDKLSLFKNSEQREYFLLNPIEGAKSTIYVPSSNEELVNKMHKVLSEKQLNDAAQASQLLPLPEGLDKTARAEMYEHAVVNGNRVELFMIIRLLLREESRQRSLGKKLLYADDNLLHAALKAVVDELCFVKKIDAVQATDYVLEIAASDGTQN